jgi:hypothetical protein
MRIIIEDDYYLGDANIEPHLLNCTIYFDFLDFCFPDNQWTDFPFAILCWWIRDIISNRNNEYAEFQLFFMDGPFKVNCIKEGNNIHMNCLDYDSRSIGVPLKKTIDFREFLRELRNAATRLLWSVEQADLGEINDFQSLRGYVKELNDIIKKEKWFT